MSIRKKIKKRLPIFGRRVRQEEAQAETSITEKQPVSPISSTPASSTMSPKSKRGETPVQDFLKNYVAEHNIVIFMKGTPSNPMCGFSATASSILSSYNVPYEHFNVFSDQDVRDGVKEFSSWPTLPQIYIGGEFMGGCDIITQMHNNGELKEEIEKVGE